jgi:hypothetical protein
VIYSACDVTATIQQNGPALHQLSISMSLNRCAAHYRTCRETKQAVSCICDQLAILVRLFSKLGEKVLLEGDAELLSNVLESVKVCLVLGLVVNLVFKTLEHSDGGGEVVDSSAGLESLLDHGRCGDQIVGETVVENSLDLKQIVSLLELLLESVLVR